MHYFLLLSVLIVLNPSIKENFDKENANRILAERYFRGIYGCELSVIDEIADENIVVSYPIFETLINAPISQGRESVREFYSGFCQRWTDTEVSIHESIAEGNNVVLVWSYRARNVASQQRGDSEERQWQSLGGISVFQFNGSGRIVKEYGEESQPGPHERIEVGYVGKK